MDITADDIRRIISYDPKTGHFTWLINQGSRAMAGRKSGTIKRAHKGAAPYVKIMISGRFYYAHRLAWLFTYGEWPKDTIDHINGDGCDNRIENLRVASMSENIYNRAVRADNAVGLKGVAASGKSGFTATIGANGKRHHLGSFPTAEQAAAAYREAADRLHGEFARTV